MDKYDIKGMTCAACSAKVEKAVRNLNGVESCSVNLLTNSMVVEGNAKESDIISAVKNAGYMAKKHGKKTTENVENENSEIKPYLFRIIFSAVILVVLLYITMGYNMWGFPLPYFLDNNYVGIGIIQLILTSIILIINSQIFIDGFKGIFKKNLNMYTLVGLGCGVAYLYSLIMLIVMSYFAFLNNPIQVQNFYNELYFESSAMIVTLITLGKTLESYSKGKTTNAIKSLIKLAPKTARLIDKEGNEVEIDVQDIKLGDRFVVKPGESIAVDATVTSGNSSVDESALTGESLPVYKNENSNVFAGTINLNGTIVCEATKVGKDTFLSKIVQMVSDATATKAPVARVADKVAGIFVPVVLGISLVTLIVWLAVGQTVGYSLARAISVLVISCPCALGLATPVAIMVGSGKGAKNNILFKTSKALEIASKTQIVVLDKTGTITTGKMSVCDIILNEDIDEQKLFEIAYLLESKSNHPIAKAITSHLSRNSSSNLEITDFKELPGKGTLANIDKKPALCGNKNFVENYVKIPQNILKNATKMSNVGKTPIYFCFDNKFLGVIAVSDTVRQTSKDAIKMLKDMGLYVVMLTGDNWATANKIAKDVGVCEVVAEVLPDEKENIIKTLQKYGKVAMVGDGINDAPALTRADVGIAIGAGTDIAIESADIVLEKNDLKDVCAAFKLAKGTLINIYENLFWAFIYNIIGIPLAAGVFIPIFGWELSPMYGALAMSLSSVCVVLNALRLNLLNIYKPSHKKIDSKFKNIKLIKKENYMKTITLSVKGMMCAHCENTVENSVKQIQGVVDANADHTKGQVTITVDRDVDIDSIKNAISTHGYEVE